MSPLTERDEKLLLHAASSCVSIRTLDQFKAWIDGPLRDYFPHKKALFASGDARGENIVMTRIIGVGLDSELEALTRTRPTHMRDLVRRCIARQKIHVINEQDLYSMLSPHERQEARMLDVRNVAAFGFRDINGTGGTFAGFFNTPRTMGKRHVHRLELVIPYVQQAITRAFFHAPAEHPRPGCAPLTRRECEVLNLMSAGLSNRAIAAALCRSEATVQNHTHSIFKKLKVGSRTAAAAAYVNRTPCMECARHPSSKLSSPAVLGQGGAPPCLASSV